MTTTRFGNNIWQLTRLSAFNTYLVRDDAGVTLIDTNMGGSAPAILAAADKSGLPITRIVLTHAHSDHVGSLDALHALLPEAEVLMSARTAAMLQGDHTLRPDEPQTPIKGGLQKVNTRPTRTIAPGDQIGTLRVVAAPGHTPDHIALLDERDGTLFAGDAFSVVGGLAVSGVMRWRFPFPALATWHRPTALASAQALRRLNPTRLAVGHGRVLENPLTAIDAAIAEAQARNDG